MVPTYYSFCDTDFCGPEGCQQFCKRDYSLDKQAFCKMNDISRKQGPYIGWGQGDSTIVKKFDENYTFLTF